MKQIQKHLRDVCFRKKDFNLCAAEFFNLFFTHLKLELLTQFPALNDEKYSKLNYWIN